MAAHEADTLIEDWLRTSSVIAGLIGDLVPELGNITFDFSIDTMRELDEFIVDYGYPTWSAEDGSSARVVASRYGRGTRVLA